MLNTIFWLFGIIGAVAFAINLLPQVIKCFKEKSAKQISVGFLILALIGNICYGSYLINLNWGSEIWKLIPIYFNYGIATTLTIILTILKYRYK